MNEGMKNLENWTEVTRGLYRYVIAAKVCYEIHILTWNHNTDILSANAALYIVGEWRTKEGYNLFERGSLFLGPLSACIEAAIEDDKKIIHK